MKNLISDIIGTAVNDCEHNVYRSPLIGYAAADDKLFTQFKSLIGPNHLLPSELLPGAKTVLAFFLPYRKDLISDNHTGTVASRSWAEAYDSTNNLIDNICKILNKKLDELGAKTAWLLPTYEFDKKELKAQWSHKHVAFACGLGTFGQNQLLITSKGCAGRFGTMVLDIELEPDVRPSQTHHCLAETGCTFCLNSCPAKAIQENSFDRHKCYIQCQYNDNLYPDLDSVEVCGKCATGPCSYIK